MNNDSHTYSVIGHPVGHSLSPLLHNHLYNILNLNLHYDFWDVFPEDLSGFVENCRFKKRPGFNVTIPHKETILPFLDGLDSLAQTTGAVNTVKNQNGILMGHNTDVTGFLFALERSGCQSREKAIILGAGGAARAVLVSLLKLNFKELHIFDIDMERSAKLIHDFQNQSSSAIRLKSIASEDLERHLGDHCLLINATPVGLCPHEEVSPVPDSKYLRPDITVFDLIPNPVHTRLLRDASAAGAKIIPGIHMLVAQALASEEIWLDCKLVDSYFDPVLNHLLRTLQKNDTTSNTHIG